MKKVFIFILLCCFVFSLAAQEKPNLPASVATSSVTSAILGKAVNVMVRLPAGYKASKKRYPVLYALQAHPHLVEYMAELAQEAHQKEGSPEMIVVGIDGGDNPTDWITERAKYDKFCLFLEQELMPGIEKQYRTNGQRALYQRSFSGLFVLYVLFTKPALFNQYIAASKDWNGQNSAYLTGLADTALQNPALFKGKKIFLATLIETYNNNIPAEADRQMRAIAEQLETRSGGGIAVLYQTFADWGPDPQPGLYEGLAFVGKQEATMPKAAKLSMQQTEQGKWVIMDSRKKVLYDVFLYDNGPEYPSGGLIRVVKNGKIGYADARTYALVIEPQFDCAYPFIYGRGRVSNNCRTVKVGEYSSWESEEWKYVDKKGQFMKRESSKL